MSGEEICVVVIPNDFPKESDDDQNTNGYGKQTTLQNITNINEKKKSKDSEEIQHDPSSTSNRVVDNEKSLSNNTMNKQTLNESSTFAEGHVDGYPCPQCEQSLASRFRYHTIPKLKLRHTIWIPTNNNKMFFVICYTELGPQSDGILDELRRAEIGIRAGTQVFIIPLSCALGVRKVVSKQKTLSPSPLEGDDDEEQEDGEERAALAPRTSVTSMAMPLHPFVKSIRAHLTVYKIISLIRQQSCLTFDYIFFCVLASMIAALGLLENSTVILVASMLVSPLMGPIMGFVIGMRINDKKLWLSGLKSESIGITASVLTGFLFGLCTTWSETKWGSSESFPTNEMRIRGDYRRLWYGAAVAVPSGAAAALSILSGNFGSLVGVAISASLLPPAVNTGLLFSYSLLSISRSNIGRHSIEKINGTVTYHSLPSLVNCTAFVDNNYLPLYSCDMAKEAGQLAVFSFIITLINIICVCLMAVVVLIIKKVAPLISDDEISNVWHADSHVNSKIDDETVQEFDRVLKTIDDTNKLSQQDKEPVV